MFRYAVTLGKYSRQVEEAIGLLHPTGSVSSIGTNGLVYPLPLAVEEMLEAEEGQTFFYLSTAHAVPMVHAALKGLCCGVLELAPGVDHAVSGIWWVGLHGLELVWTPQDGVVLPPEHNYPVFYTAERPAVVKFHWAYDTLRVQLPVSWGLLPDSTPQLRRLGKKLREWVQEYKSGMGNRLELGASGEREVAFQVRGILRNAVREAIAQDVVQMVHEVYGIPHVRVESSA